MRRFLRAVIAIVVSSVTVPVAVAGTVLASFLVLPLPATAPTLHAAIDSQISHVYDINGAEIGVFRKFEQSIPVRQTDIPAVLKQAVVASEDRHFYSHRGVDMRGTFRALVSDLRGQAIRQGGSTITQQYVKNASRNDLKLPARTFTQKFRETILANQLERSRRYSKEDILFRYLSSIYLGEGAYGVGAAAETYFRKPVSKLTLSESALLAGIIPAPSAYQPRSNSTGADARRRQVLALMLEQGAINQAQHDEAVAQQVWLAVRGKPPGPATIVYPPQQRQTKFPYYVDYVKKYLEQRYGEDVVNKGGLRIQTALDPALQAAAEKSVADSLKGTGDPLEMALASVEPPTGFVKALVGGRDFYSGPYSQVNLALANCPSKSAIKSPQKIEVTAACWDDPKNSAPGGGNGRQTGSAFKAFTLAAALQQGIQPSKVYRAPRTITIGKYTASNNEGEGGGSATVRSATTHSINTVFVQMIQDVGVKKVAEMAKKLGINTAFYTPEIHGLSYTLGVIDVAPLDMASAYGVFATGGQRFPSTPIVKVVTAGGKVLEDNRKRQGEQVLEKVVADNVTDILRTVIDSGTGTHANIGRPAAGKTGTGENFTNAWFVGYTPTLSTAVWMGYANNQKTPLRNIKGVPRVFGGTIPAGTWKAFMTAALKDVPITDFSEPAPIRNVADALERKARGGFDAGPKRGVTATGDGGPYEVTPGAPVASPPPTTTSSTAPSGGGGGDDGGGGPPTTGFIFP
ncbi:MAG: penicillin-binding protein [Actinobacteria bacterium]|nr:penicillin-binding protein [Actinomycetota bacterium]